MIRRIMIAALTFTIMVTAVSCQKKEPVKYQASFLELFNTVTEIVGYAKSKEEFEDFANLIYDGLEEYHKLYDKYNTYEGINNIKTINDNAGIAPVKVDRKIIDLLLFSREAYLFTDDKVNVALGSVLNIWHDYRTAGIEDPANAKLPPMEELTQANEHTDISRMIIDEEESTVYLEDPFMSLDVGAIAKGYATEQVALSAIDRGYEDFLLSVGGNVRSSGLKGTNGELWKVGIQNPDKESEVKSIMTLGLTNLSLVNSGDYERYYMVDGKRYHHIINPDTLMPAQYYSAVSIVCEDSGMADALSTAIFNMPFEDGKALIESLDKVEALWIYPDGRMEYSDHFKDYIQ